MPAWPCNDGKRHITIELPAEHVEHLDAQARYKGMSRAAYVRGLIVDDIVRQGPGRMAKD
jgi:predicted DNA-binding protein